jgi:hypothetical protein
MLKHGRAGVPMEVVSTLAVLWAVAVYSTDLIDIRRFDFNEKWIFCD